MSFETSFLADLIYSRPKSRIPTSELCRDPVLVVSLNYQRTEAYEATDCRLFYTLEHLSNAGQIWVTVAGQAFGVTDTKPYSLCVDGSTNHKSSLSGNATLFHDGNPTNVTDFVSSWTSGSGSENGTTPVDLNPANRGKPNDAGKLHVGSLCALCITVFAALMAL